MDAFWSVLSVVVILAAFGIGAPVLLRGGGQLQRRGTFRLRVRVRGGGPGMLASACVALIRHADSVALALITVAMMVLIVLNAQA